MSTTSPLHGVDLLIDNEWRPALSGRRLDVPNPATGEAFVTVAHAGIEDLDIALAAAQRGFATWRAMSPYDRSAIMRRAAAILRERTPGIASLLTQEQGKPVAESVVELRAAADIIEWFAEEGRRTYGRLIPGRSPQVTQKVIKEPVGPVAAFTPWNFPVNQAVRKISAALAAGCSILLKGPEETPASCAELVRAYVDAGLPPGVVGLVYGTPAEISGYLIPHPVIRKISFTGSTAVGKQLAALAGSAMKRVTMELGGHAPAIIFADADLDAAAGQLVLMKFRNAGQTCIAATRFLVHESVHDAFLERFLAKVAQIKVGNGLDEGVTMGPLANVRRVQAMEVLIGDALAKGAQLACGGHRIGSAGNFFAPTVLTGVTPDMRAMNEEPFGPLALVRRFSCFEEVEQEINRLPYGLATYAYTRDAATIASLTHVVESGMLSINHLGLALPETPFGGVKDSGYGSEGGLEAVETYLVTKFVSEYQPPSG
ncbi:NAD-dependent succinate-semialdehyde dehydrogenase [Caldimonas thermodepolymerans]|uniref:NAD-dependent succinate-semialdehyde dehydrogenase n=1 Tax=Caldimonas thermodepolymerans TaxID=215580 RepID=A0A2S5T4I4_9BURK|nr:NAD-dependent succinate-semialdehyde dehydrogenase [Caldimonas thermodepolymerans]PPE69905.1 NAD-dependent succinate-semialdehyde dehydrogenase [Caldimonas thermodepolymerans]QPC31634.1 NAD-dependent succinate-semialdehyde dehydrogenase [Caldimonas thermodepolymerans]RDH94774.1 succinate semialdehyde dehydrogenase [Caldimonas thermodepolymerans]